MTIKMVLGFLDLFRWVFPLLRVDYVKLRNILWVKLTTDSRRVYLDIQTKTDSKTGYKKNTFTKLLWFHMFAGTFLGVIVFQVKALFAAMIIVHGFILMMAIMSLLTHFTTILFDTTENSVLLCRPVDGRTVFLSRVLHTFFYLFSIIGALGLTVWVVGTVKYGVMYFIGFFFSLFLSTFLSIFLIYLFYLGALVIVGGEKFRDVLTFFEVFFPVVLMVIFFSYGKDFVLEKIVISMMGWTYFAPPAWFAGLIEALVTNRFHSPYGWYILLSFGVPLVCMVLSVLFLAPTFNRRLSRMEIEVRKKASPPSGVSVISFFSRVFGRGGVERTVFEMVWKLSGRDKKYMLNTYPLLGTLFMFFFIIGIVPYKTLSAALIALPGTQRHLALLYVSILMLITAISQLPYSDLYKAAWIYRAFPVSAAGEIFSGGVKAVIVKFSFPTYITAGVVVVLWGPGVIADIVFAYLNILLLCIHLAFISVRCLPFSLKPSVVSMSGKIIRTLSALVLYIGLSYGHYRLTEYPYAVIAGIIPMALLVFYFFRRYKGIPWPAASQSAL